MPNNNQESDNQLRTMTRKIQDAVSVDIAEQLLSGTGKSHALINVLPTAKDRSQGLVEATIRGHIERLSNESEHSLAKVRARGLVTGQVKAGSPVLRPIDKPVIAPEAVKAVTSLRELLRRKWNTGKTAEPEAAPEIKWGADDWKYVQLRVDYVKCKKRVKASKTGEVEGKRDEMWMTGTLLDIGNPGEVHSIDFHLGDFKEGETNNYGVGDSSRVVASVDVSDAQSLPTGVMGLLVVVEKDYEKQYGEMVVDILEKCRDEVIKMIESGDFNGDGKKDWDLGKWAPVWVKLIIAATIAVVGLVIHWAKIIARPEILSLDDSGEPAFVFDSPDVTKPSDRWGASHRGPTEVFTMKGYGGTYEIAMYYARSKTKLGA